MRYPACEKLEIIRLVEQSHLPMRQTLEKLGIQPATDFLNFTFAKCLHLTPPLACPFWADFVAEVI